MISSSESSRLWVGLKVNGNTVANIYVRWPEGNYIPISLTSIQKLEAGQTVTIEYFSESSSGLGYDETGTTNWSGMYLGSSILTPPTCEYAGQTFPYPGSCRKHYRCKSNNTTEVVDCCPNVYVHDAGSCLSKNYVNVDSLCNRDDNC